MKIFKPFLSLMILCTFMIFSEKAHALLILYPNSQDPDPPAATDKWTGNETANLNAADISGIVGVPGLQELYKQNVSESLDTGTLAGSYATTFYNTPTDPADALIDVNGTYLYGTAYLFVKDGNQEPAWYLFNLFAFGWNGIDDIKLEGFWPEQGAISHVAIYGNGTPVPEPATIFLLGAGLIGLAGYGRKKLG
jgi:hypothetical protein